MRKKTRDMLDGMTPEKDKGGRPTHKATAENKAKVLELANLGVPQPIICIALDVSLETLYKYYDKELNAGKVEVVQSLLKTAKERSKESDAVLIFLLKTIAGLKESEIVDANGALPKIVEIRVTHKGERIAQPASIEDDI